MCERCYVSRGDTPCRDSQGRSAFEPAEMRQGWGAKRLQLWFKEASTPCWNLRKRGFNTLLESRRGQRRGCILGLVVCFSEFINSVGSLPPRHTQSHPLSVRSLRGGGVGDGGGGGGGGVGGQVVGGVRGGGGGGGAGAVKSAAAAEKLANESPIEYRKMVSPSPAVCALFGFSRPAHAHTQVVYRVCTLRALDMHMHKSAQFWSLEHQNIPAGGVQLK